MRGRLGFVPSGCEAEEEMEGRFRGFVGGGGGEDIFSFLPSRFFSFLF